MWRRPWRMRRRLKGGMRGGRDGCTFFKDRYIDFWCGFGVDLRTPDEMIWWLWSRMRGLNYSLLVTVVAPKKMFFFFGWWIGDRKGSLYIFLLPPLLTQEKRPVDQDNERHYAKRHSTETSMRACLSKRHSFLSRFSWQCPSLVPVIDLGDCECSLLWDDDKHRHTQRTRDKTNSDGEINTRGIMLLPKSRSKLDPSLKVREGPKWERERETRKKSRGMLMVDKCSVT
jgi:hypothetical protein